MTIRPDTNDLLVAEATTAWRPRDRDGLPRTHPAWADLPPERRIDVHDDAAALRRLEAALDPNGLSTTVRAVLARICAAEGG